MKHEKTALLNTLEAYFRAGIKSSYHQKIGVEVEHFILNEQTGEALPYAGSGGVMEILKALMALYPGAKATGGDHLLGFEVPEFNITLEPAAQLEISIAFFFDKAQKVIVGVGNSYAFVYIFLKPLFP